MDAEDRGAAGNLGATSGTAQRDLKFELYKLEYERAAIRYNDIYQALWQIFSYMSAISGALLAFGGDRFQENLFWFLTCSPLVFWFWGTYEPLNRYGTNCGERLGAIEEDLNKTYGTHMDHYRGFDRRTTTGVGFKRHRVRHIVGPIFLVLTLFWGYQAFRAVWTRCSGVPLLRERPSEVRIVTVDTEELKKLIEGAKSIGQTPPVPPKGAPAKTKTN
jgi:hypothetical protein